MAIFGHSEFIPVFMRKKKCWNSQKFPDLYQSFWEKLLEKIQNSHFWPFGIYTSLFGKNCQEKFGTAIFGHSEFIPVLWKKLSEKIWNGHFWPF